MLRLSEPADGQRLRAGDPKDNRAPEHAIATDDHGRGVEFIYAGMVGASWGQIRIQMGITGEFPGGSLLQSVRPSEWVPFDMIVRRDR